MNNHALFPVLVSEFHYDEHKQFKNIFFNSVFDHLNDRGVSDESTGHVTIHHDDRYKYLYTFVVSCIKEFIKTYNVNPELFDINIVKSWLNITGGQSNPNHNHADAHIAFVYYVHVPENVYNSIRFYNYVFRHEPFTSFCKISLVSSSTKSNVSKYFKICST